MLTVQQNPLTYRSGTRGNARNRSSMLTDAKQLMNFRNLTKVWRWTLHASNGLCAGTRGQDVANEATAQRKSPVQLVDALSNLQSPSV